MAQRVRCKYDIKYQILAIMLYGTCCHGAPCSPCTKQNGTTNSF